MRLRPELRFAMALGLVLLALCGICSMRGAWAAPQDAQGFSAEQVQAAVAQVRADPGWGRTTQEQKLKFKPPEEKPKQPDTPPAARNPRGSWWVNFVQWLSEASRIFIWVLGALAVALVLVGVRHWVRVRADAEAPLTPLLPSHVSRLDIRPQSLPSKVGEAAAAMWARGEHRLALSLLYRGVLSRLVHQHGVPIVAASTEDECVALAQHRIDATRATYVQRTVGAWQLAVYGGQLPESALVLGICHEFELHFAQPPVDQGRA